MTKAYLLGFICAATDSKKECPYYDTTDAYQLWHKGYDDANDYWNLADDELDGSNT